MKQVIKYILIAVGCFYAGWKLAFFGFKLELEKKNVPYTSKSFDDRVKAVIERRQAAARRYS